MQHLDSLLMDSLSTPQLTQLEETLLTQKATRKVAQSHATTGHAHPVLPTELADRMFLEVGEPWPYLDPQSHHQYYPPFNRGQKKKKALKAAKIQLRHLVGGRLGKCSISLSFSSFNCKTGIVYTECFTEVLLRVMPFGQFLHVVGMDLSCAPP